MLSMNSPLLKPAHTLFQNTPLSFLLVLGLSFSIWGQDIQINEFLASNVRDYPEMYDFGDYNDWIELHNTSDSPISLDGYFLSDNLNNPLKWRIPGTASIPGQGYLLVWADDYDDGPGSIYTRETWPYDDYSTRHYHTNFKLSKSGEDLVLAQADITSTTSFIPTESFWKYQDNGSNLDPSWIENNFDDASWAEGQAELGYGDGDENTVVDYGDDSNQKQITTYFRKTFIVNDPNAISNLITRIKRDDGAVVYLNGNEVIRSNLPSGDITYGTLASTAVSSAEEDAFYEYTISTNELIAGENCLAVEIHQISETSSDISFDLELVGINYSEASIVDYVSFGEQVTDVSYGRPPGAMSWTFFGEPTPQYENLTPSSADTDKTTAVATSVASGFYNGAISVSLSTASSQAQIHYTLDGSRPGSSSPLYSGSITIEATTVVKARSFETGLLPGELMTATYFIDEQHFLPTISLVAEPPTLWDADIGIYENEYKQREIPVSIHYFQQDTETGFRIDAGARLGGLNIWTKPQKPFTIYTRDRFGEDLIPYQIFKSKPISDFSRIVFRNGGDDWEETLLRDPMTGSLVKGMMDCGYMAYQPSALFLNGEYWGIYNIREKYNTRYFFENFGADPDNIDHLEYGATQAGTRLLTIEGDQLAYNDFISFVQNSDLDQSAVYDELSDRMNIDGFIDHVVMTLYCANTSWGHNREWWRPRGGDGKWQWLIVDVDRGFNPSNVNNNLLDNLLRDYLLFQYLMVSERFRDRFLQRAAAHFNNTFLTERVERIVDSLSNTITDEMPRHIDRWGSQGGISSMTSWENETEAIKTFAQNRTANLFDHFNSHLILNGTIDMNLATYPSEGGHILINDVPQLSENNTGTYFRDHPLHLTAVPAPGWEVVGWSGISDSTSILYTCETDTSFIALFQPSTGNILPAQIQENTTLLGNQTYYVSENLQIPAGLTLTLEAGVEILMPEQGHIIVDGHLLINGTNASPVIISPNVETGTLRWGGISFSNATDTSRINHLSLSGASKGVDPIIHRGAISGHNANLIIDHLDIQDVLFPIYIQGGSVKLLNSSLRCEFISDFINVKRAEVLIDNCTFYGSQAPDTDAIDLDGVESGVVSNNHIYNFAGPNSDGIDLGERCVGILITDNQIYHSSDKGISVGQHSTTSIERNLIVGCKWGVAVKDSSVALLLNNTYANNEISLVCFEKNVGNGGGEAWERNSIYSNSLISTLFVDAFSAQTVTYSLSNAELMMGAGNLYDEPLFVDPGLYNFELTPNSPCMDAGDPGDPLDENGSPRDMGAYYSFNPDDYPFPIPGRFISFLKINEFLASNSTSNADESGEYDDWIEIYNPTEETLDISNLYLTDNPNNLTKWQFPEMSSTIEPGDFLLIWCDEDGSQGPLHANFKLSASGEFIALVDSNGLSVIDSLTFGAQTTDISWGRVPDGSNNWAMLSPTPGNSNQFLDLVSMPSIPEQFALHQNYPNPFNPNTTIRYELPEPAEVQVLIYDLRGRLIRTLVNETQTAGYKTLIWDGSNHRGKPGSAGVYLCHIVAGEYTKTIKMVSLK